MPGAFQTLPQIQEPAALAKLLAGDGAPVHLKLAFGFATADAAVLATVPAGLKFRIQATYLEIITSFTGGTTPAVGASSDDADYNTKGDIWGGASGDVTATLVSTGRKFRTGTIGAKFAAAITGGIVVVGSGKVIRYDRIADAFTAGAGFLHIDGWLTV